MTTISLVRLARLADLKDGAALHVDADGVAVVVVKCGGAVSVFDGICPHQGTLLGDGHVADGTLVCSGHGWRFDCASVAKVGDSAVRLHRFDAAVDDGEVVITSDELQAFREQRRRRVAPPGDAAATTPARDLASLPGPKGLPLVGNLFELGQERQHLMLEQWADTYGPLYRFHIGRQPVVVAADAALLEQVLKQRPETYGRMGAIGSVMDEIGAGGVFSAEGDEWRRQRKVTTQALSPAHLRHFHPTMTRIAARLKARWDAAAAADDTVDVLDDMTRFTLDVTCAFALGHDLNTLEGRGETLEKQLAEVTKALTRRGTALLPYWRFVKLSADRALDRAMAGIHQTIARLVGETRRRLADDPQRMERPGNFLEALLVEQSRADGFTDEDVAGNVVTIMAAGQETTAETLAWLLYFLCERPDVQRLLQAEADAVLGSEPILRDFAGHQRLVRTEAAAHETMRQKPVAPVIWLESRCATELGGVRLPAHTPVFLLTRRAALREHVGSAVQAFDPGRWLAADGSGVDATEAKSFFPFGAGPRFCPGRFLALVEIKVVASMLCRSFTVERADGGTEVEEHFTFTMRPAQLAVRLRHR